MKLQFKEVTKHNFRDIIKLSNTLPEGQQKCVAPNVYSIAEGSLNENAYYRAIYLDDTPIGFFMVSIPTQEMKEKGEDTDFFLWRFMIAYEHQGKHYGTKTLDHIVEMGKTLGYDKLLTSCHIGGVSPYDFYIRYGFEDTNKMEDGEEVLVYHFDK